MVKIESESRKRTQRNQLRKMILSAIKTAGVLSIALIAPNVVGAMAKLGLLPSKRQSGVVRRSCDRLVDSGLLEWQGNRLRLTPKGDAALRSFEVHEFSRTRPRSWDRKWRVLVFDIPERRKALRDKIRNTLNVIGFVRLQDSVWVYPYDCEDLMTLLKADFKVGRDMLYMVVYALEGDALLRKRFGLPR